MPGSADRPVRPEVRGFHEPQTGSVQYVVADPTTRRCAIIDPVLDYDPASGSVATRSADAILAQVAAERWCVDWVLDTHPHADHLSAADYLRNRTGARSATGARVAAIQALWADLYGLPDLCDTSCWDRLFEDGDGFTIGSIEARAMLSPGHTLSSLTYVVGNAAFIHDTLFMPDGGTARADFPGGDARALWRSIEAILSLPETTRLFTGHDYTPGGRPPQSESSVAAQRRDNPHVAGQTEASFVALREARDRTLPMPRMLLHALQVNLRGGRLPEPDARGRRHLRIPLGIFPDAPWDGKG